MTRTADPRPPRFDCVWLLFGVVPLAVLLAALRPSIADDGFLAIALARPVGIEAPACSRENATDMLVQPAGQVDCPRGGQVLATHLGLAPGERHKVVCERRKG
ncbi:hypothetical protein [Methylorubrum extorquens]|uniref:Uncharacterized protein n=1 Tax=Methylorubrum extorquens TaxID=408 RepID=A0AAX3WPQ3_METEX|nr:hypothetical protein [Methylorubrum extorquens]WHQ72535.1 hypothetical protein KEC54_13770 [Methylorubrum extorquens]